MLVANFDCRGKPGRIDSLCLCRRKKTRRGRAGFLHYPQSEEQLYFLPAAVLPALVRDWAIRDSATFRARSMLPASVPSM